MSVARWVLGVAWLLSGSSATAQDPEGAAGLDAPGARGTRVSRGAAEASDGTATHGASPNDAASGDDAGSGDDAASDEDAASGDVSPGASRTTEGAPTNPQPAGADPAGSGEAGSDALPPVPPPPGGSATTSGSDAETSPGFSSEPLIPPPAPLPEEARRGRIREAPPRRERSPEGVRRSALSVQVLRPFFGTFTLQFEHRLTPFLSLMVAPSAVVVRYGSGDDLLGFGIEGALRFYPSTHAPSGFWAGPRVGLGRLTGKSFGRSRADIAFTVGAQVGYTWHLGGFVLSVGGGFSFVDTEVDVEGASILGYRGFWPDANLAVGWAFGPRQ